MGVHAEEAPGGDQHMPLAQKSPVQGAQENPQYNARGPTEPTATMGPQQPEFYWLTVALRSRACPG